MQQKKTKNSQLPLQVHQDQWDPFTHAKLKKKNLNKKKGNFLQKIKNLKKHTGNPFFPGIPSGP